MKRLALILLLLVTISLFAGESGKGTVSTDSTTYQWKATFDLNQVNRLSFILDNTGDGTAYYDLRFFPSDDFEDYIYEGVAEAAGDSLYDTDGDFADSLAIVGEYVYNVSDGSSGIITAATDSVITATLSGGTDNAWAVGDYYKVLRPLLYYSYSDSLATGSQLTMEKTNFYSQMKLFIKKYATTDSTATFKYQFKKLE